MLQVRVLMLLLHLLECLQAGARAARRHAIKVASRGRLAATASSAFLLKRRVVAIAAAASTALAVVVVGVRCQVARIPALVLIEMQRLLLQLLLLLGREWPVGGSRFACLPLRLLR